MTQTNSPINTATLWPQITRKELVSNIDSQWHTIPTEILEQLNDKKCHTTSFGAGPSCAAGQVQKFSTPIDFIDAVIWQEQRRQIAKAGCIELTDGSLVWFRFRAFDRWECGLIEQAPRPGDVYVLTDSGRWKPEANQVKRGLGK